MSKSINAMATAVWLVENTTLTFKQIAEFAIYTKRGSGTDGEVAKGIKAYNPIITGQLSKKRLICPLKTKVDL